MSFTDKPILYYLVFFTAGIPALIYQVVWQRVLTLYFGVDIYSTAISVSTFMLGLGIGSLVGGRIADRVKRPLSWYLAIEAAIGLFGFLSIGLISLVGHWLAGSSAFVLIPVDFAMLLVPTLLMGSTLPLMVKSVAASEAHLGEHLSWLYGVNTLGAAFGAGLSSYLLIGWLGFEGAVNVAASINLGLALFLLWLIRGHATSPTAGTAGTQPTAAAEGRAEWLSYPWILLLSFVSGFVALGYQMVWYRLLVTLLKGTTYAFGTILLFFLAGLAIGSIWAHRRIDNHYCLRNFTISQLGIAVYSMLFVMALTWLSWLPGLKHLISASFFTTFHPSPLLLHGEVTLAELYSALDVALWPLLIFGLPTLLMGYGFPNLMRAASHSLRNVGHTISAVYFWNVLGSTLGSLLFGFVVLDLFGSEVALRLLILIGLLLVLLMVYPLRRGRTPLALGYTAAGASALFGVLLVFPQPGELLRSVHLADFDTVDFEIREDKTGVVALRRQHEVIAFSEERRVLGEQMLYISGARHGKVQAAGELDDQRMTRIALSTHPAPQKVLSIGLGDGKMIEGAIDDPAVNRVDIIELSGVLMDVLATTPRGQAIDESRKVNLRIDDGRRWLLANPGARYDVIMMWPLHAAHAYYNNLYSREFLQLLRDRLNPGGLLFLQTVDAHSSARTLSETFPFVLRLGRRAYIAAQGPIAFDQARAGIGADELRRLTEADRESILANTAASRANTDLVPNSEYYLTYPQARFLSSRTGGLYSFHGARDDNRHPQAGDE